MAACHNNSSGTASVEHLEIFKTTGDDKNMQAGDMTHHEATDYEGSRKKSTSYFDTNGKLKGKEIFIYETSKDTVPVKADYVDDQQKLLSYYKYVVNGNGQMVASYAFDASNHELLRVEQYYYLKNLMTSKRIFDAQLNPSRRYAFSHDINGNEVGFQVYNAADSLVTKEEFKITKLDAHNKWVEKWGFANGKPVTLHKRKIE
jgi:hypothetical protein